MPQPEDVRPHNFSLRRVLCNDGEFSVALGTWNEDDTTRVAMRWNGEEGSFGYPSQGGNPLWFQLPEYLGVPVLAALIDREGARNKEIIVALENLIS